MRKGRNSGKKLMAARIVKHTLEIIHLLTDQNPVQVCQHTYIRGVCCVCVFVWQLHVSNDGVLVVLAGIDLTGSRRCHRNSVSAPVSGWGGTRHAGREGHSGGWFRIPSPR